MNAAAKKNVTENEIGSRQTNSRDDTFASNESPSTAENEIDVTDESNDDKIVSKRGAPTQIYKRNAPTRDAMADYITNAREKLQIL